MRELVADAPSGFVVVTDGAITPEFEYPNPAMQTYVDYERQKAQFISLGLKGGWSRSSVKFAASGTQSTAFVVLLELRDEATAASVIQYMWMNGEEVEGTGKARLVVTQGEPSTAYIWLARGPYLCCISGRGDEEALRAYVSDMARAQYANLCDSAETSSASAAATPSPSTAGDADAYNAMFEFFYAGRGRDPYPAYDRMRAPGPMYQMPWGMWVATGYHPVDALLKSDALIQDQERDFAEGNRPDWRDHPALALAPSTMLGMNQPDHTRLRRLAAAAFNPRTVEALRPRVDSIVTDLLEPLAGAGEVDLMSTLARPLPIAVISELVGVPVKDREFFLNRSADLLLLEPGYTNEDLERADAAAASVRAYFESLVTERRRAPQDDLTSALIAARDEQDRLSEEELVANLTLIYGAGFVTTTHLIGNAVRAFFDHPEQAKALRDDRSLSRGAVEETLRFDTPVQATSRRVGRSVTIDGHTLDEGKQVLAILGAGNRDATVYESPDDFDITRAARGAPHPLSFGAGIHYCLGAALARLEGEIVITTLFADG